MLYQVSSNRWFRDEGHNKVNAVVFVVAEDAQTAQQKAIAKFKEQIKELDQDFNSLQELDKEELELLYTEDASMEALHSAANGYVQVEVVTDGVTDCRFI